MKHLLSWLGPLILIGTLLVSIPRYAAAFIQAEPTIFSLPTAPITGLGFGLLLELGIYYVIDSWFDARRRGLKFHWVLLVGVAAQLVLGPVIVAPAIVGHLRATPGELGAVLDGDVGVWGWAVVVAAAPALLLAAVAAASFMREPAKSDKDRTKTDRLTTETDTAQPSPDFTPRWPDKAAFMSDPDRTPDMTVAEVVTQAGVTDRTARRWLKAARNGGGH